MILVIIIKKKSMLVSNCFRIFFYSVRKKWFVIDSFLNQYILIYLTKMFPYRCCYKKSGSVAAKIYS